jgi:hypothetical protein
LGEKGIAFKLAAVRMEVLCFMEFEQEAIEENREGKTEKRSTRVEEVLTRVSSSGRNTGPVR